MTAISFVCGLFAGDEHTVPPMCRGLYSPEWADRLYRGIARNLDSPFELVVLVDRDYVFQEPVRAVPMQRPDLGWMALLEAFRPDIGIERGIFVGLDTIIVGSLNELASIVAPLAMPRDPTRLGDLCNAVVSFSAAKAAELWGLFSKQPDRWAQEHRMCRWDTPNGYPSEFKWLQAVVNVKSLVWLDDLLPGQIVSYRLACLREQEQFPTTDPSEDEIVEWMRMRMTRIPANSRLVFFHGIPKPHQLGPSPGSATLLDHWR